jgi:hypothetical protein
MSNCHIFYKNEKNLRLSILCTIDIFIKFLFLVPYDKIHLL